MQPEKRCFFEEETVSVLNTSDENLLMFNFLNHPDLCCIMFNYHNTGVVGGGGGGGGIGIGVSVGVVGDEEEERREGGAPYILKLCGSAVGVGLALGHCSGAPRRHTTYYRVAPMSFFQCRAEKYARWLRNIHGNGQRCRLVVARPGPRQSCPRICMAAGVLFSAILVYVATRK
jgi:hypothetical protein